MALTPIPIGEKPYYNIDPISKGMGISDTCYDGYIDESKTVNRRGALKQWTDLGTALPGDGLYYWRQIDCLLAVSGGRIWRVSQSGIKTEMTGAPLNTQQIAFAAGNKIDGSPWLYLFDGGYPIYTLGGTTITRLTSASGAPSASSFGCWTSGRFLVMQDGTRKFYATDTNPTTGNMENDYFLASENPLTAESRPDNLMWLGVSWEEILSWGSDGLEYWRDDDTFFSPIAGTFSPVGLLAPRSVVEADNSVFALCTVDNGNKRAIIKMQGRTPQVLSLPIEQILHRYAVVEDAIGFLTNNSEYVLTFPTEKVTWCYDYRNNVWYPWSRWNDLFAEREEFLGRHSAFAWGKTFVQSRVDGKIFIYDHETFQDDGTTVATEYVTSRLDHGTKAVKRSNKLRVHFKRGQGDESGSEPVLVMRYRDNGSKEWRPERQLSLGKQGQYSDYIDISGLGLYMDRQYSFILTDNAALALVAIEEDVTRMSR